MILLSKEECFEMVGELPTSYEEDLVLVAKAQLKKVVKWLQQRDEFDVVIKDHLGDVGEWAERMDIGRFTFISEGDWQALLKEVE